MLNEAEERSRYDIEKRELGLCKKKFLLDTRERFNKYEEAMAKCPLCVAFSLADAREPLGLAISQNAALQLSH
jgi:hypothetical protein